MGGVQGMFRRVNPVTRQIDCPITYAAWAILGKEVQSGLYVWAAKSLGMPEILATRIAGAADDDRRCDGRVKEGS